MRVTLIHNREAGNGEYVREELLVALARHGHVLHASVDTLTDATLEAIASDPGDAIAIAGGDGTVRSVALGLMGRGAPLLVLPMGTANNIARALGLPPDPVAVLRRLADLEPSGFDVGRIAGSWGESRFLEGAGFGPFVRTALLLSHPTQKETFEDTDARLARDRELLEKMIRDYSPQACEVVLDDECVSGDFLAVHLMNLPSVGPNLDFAPDADFSDGCLDVMLVKAGERQRFTEFVAANRGCAPENSPFPVHRSRTVRLRWEGAEIHIDDEFHQAAQATELLASVEARALTFLRSPGHARTIR